MLFSTDDHAHMARALRLAEKGLWTTAPNPRVGCVLMRDGQVVGEGWHRAAGEPHAEVLALMAAGSQARGATAYVTLEPCAHHGRTPPCAGALIEAGVAEVVAAVRDPHPAVDGRGLERLEAAGIRVRSGLMERQARELNIGFFHRLEHGRPWVRVKLAASLDGRSAGPGGESKWITGPEARADGQRWRARAGAILTGIGTVLADDPQLTVRIEGASRQPLVVVADSRGRLSPDARVLKSGAPVLVASRVAGLEGMDCEWLVLDGPGQRLPLDRLLAELARREVNEVHVEAGPELSGALIDAGLADEIVLYLAPCLIGAAGQPVLELPGVEKLAGRHHVRVLETRTVGADLRVRARIESFRES